MTANRWHLPRPRWRVFLRGGTVLFAVVLVVGIPLGWSLSLHLQQSWRQQDVVESIAQHGGRALYDYQLDDGLEPAERQQPQQVSWLRGFLGDDFFYTIALVDLAGTRVSDRELKLLGNLADIRVLDLRGTQVTDAGMARLVNLGRLSRLDVRGTRVTDWGIQLLRERRPDLLVLYDRVQPPSSAEPEVRPAPAFVRRSLRKEKIIGEVDAGLGSKATPARTGDDRHPPIEATPELRPAPATEVAIERGLEFLSVHQAESGSWSLSGWDADAPSLKSDTAATGLVLLTMLGAGYDHRADNHQETVRRGLEYLIEHQQPDGDLYAADDERSAGVVRLYSHSIATLALCEAYGMTQDPWLRQPAQKAIDFLAASQDSKRGGWRYQPGVGSDTSVTGWVAMALRSAQLAGLDVPDDAIAGVNKWLDAAQVSPSEPYLYCYNPFAPDTPEQRHGRRANETMTAVGLLMRLYLGWNRGGADLMRGADYLVERLPTLDDARKRPRDAYYWYYATQVLMHVGGEHWQRWNEALHPLLVSGQIRAGELAGSWDPLEPQPDRWGPQAGRLYVTTLNLLTLEVYYRVLPLYDDTAR